MMKKGMVRFLAAAMVAVTVMGTAVAATPAKEVFAAEVETATENSDSVDGVKTMATKLAEEYVQSLVGNADPCEEYDNCKVYRVAGKVYSISTFEHEPEIINKKFFTTYEWMDKKVENYYHELLRQGMINGEYKKVGDGAYTIKGILPMITLSIKVYEQAVPVDTIKITADKTMVRPGQCVNLKLTVNEGADPSFVTWRVVAEDGVADFWTNGTTEAFVAGYTTGTVMVIAETADGVRDYVHVNIVDFE